MSSQNSSYSIFCACLAESKSLVMVCLLRTTARTSIYLLQIGGPQSLRKMCSTYRQGSTSFALSLLPLYFMTRVSKLERLARRRLLQPAVQSSSSRKPCQDSSGSMRDITKFITFLICSIALERGYSIWPTRRSSSMNSLRQSLDGSTACRVPFPKVLKFSITSLNNWSVYLMLRMLPKPQTLKMKIFMDCQSMPLTSSL